MKVFSSLNVCSDLCFGEEYEKLPFCLLVGAALGLLPGVLEC